MPVWSLYLLRTRTGHLYTGISTDVDRRFREHQAGSSRAARSLRGKGPLQLVFSAEVGSRGSAARLEYCVKQLARQQKEALISGRLQLAELEAGLANPSKA